jgi:hypothetical protein
MSNPSSDSYRNPLRHTGQDYSFAPRYYRPRDPLPPQNASRDIKPKENQGYYPLASFWSNSTNGNLWVLTDIVNNLANWVLIGTTNGSLLTLSDNSNTVVFPSLSGATPPDNIQITGQLNEQPGATPSPFQTIIANPANHSININPMSGSRWIVDPLSTATNPNGTHTTIQAAINSAIAGDTILIMPGSYTQDLTLTPGVNLAAYSCDALTPNVSIIGNTTLSSAGKVSISGINLQTNNNFCLSVTGSSASVINCIDCNITGVANACIVNSSSSAGSMINFFMCNGNQQQAGHILFNNSGNGSINFSYCQFNNTGNNTSSSVCSSGVVNAMYTLFAQPFTFSGTGQGTWYGCVIDTTAINVTCMTFGGGTTEGCSYCVFRTGTAVAITISTRAILALCTIVALSTPAITGSGLLFGNDICFGSSGSGFSTTLSITQDVFGVSGFWPTNPNIQIGGSSAGITYTTQTGGYTWVGNIVTFWCNILLSSKGSNTGTVTISNLPVSSGLSGANQSIAVSQYSNLTGFTGSNVIGLQLGTSSTVGTFIASPLAGANGVLTNTNLTNTSSFTFNGTYITD